MKLVASMIVAEAEADRYLIPCVDHLLAFCDEVVLLIDGDRADWETDWTRLGSALGVPNRVVGVRPIPPVRFYDHEGRARQALLDATLARDPTHILAIDADEFVSDGALVRAACRANQGASWNLCMQEVWAAEPGRLRLRFDGQWGERSVPILFAPGKLPGPLAMPDRALASGRTPTAVAGQRAGETCSAILHFGWARKAEREQRYARYVEHDGGRFHAASHLASIMSPDDRVTLLDRQWPSALVPYMPSILAHASP